MQRHEIRLEVLKLVHRFDREPAANVAIAKHYEQYIVEPEAKSEVAVPVSAPTEKRKPGRPPNKE
jgi:hypothetical protein